MTRTVIAVDGLAGSGKTTISKLLAERLGFLHLSSGLAYRGVALLVLRTRTDVDNEQQLVSMLKRHRIELRAPRNGTSVALYVDGEDVTSQVHSPEVSEATSKSACHPGVRASLLALQRDAFEGRDLVAEGRDMGTVVFPDAAVKIFIEADPKVRISRRMKQLGKGGSARTDQELAQQMLKEITERDARDAGREVAPALPATDAVMIDNSSKSLEEVMAEILSVLKARRIASKLT